MTEYHWTEVDGVTTIWTESPGPLRAGLLFRTGRVDEPVIKSGYTHLIEHMTMSAAAELVHDSTGYVMNIATGFVTMGLPGDVSIFFNKICNALCSLPADRLEAEKQILEAEIAARSYDARSNLLMWRYGTRGHGMMMMPELGIRRATIEHLHEFSKEKFTRENAILWVAGSVPADLHLNLPTGAKQPLPPLNPLPPEFPCWIVDDLCKGIAVGATVPRVSASTIFNLIATKRLLEKLRTEKAVSYSPFVFYDQLSSDTAHMGLYADSNPDRRAELTEVFGDVFENLTKVDETEVENARKQILDHWIGKLSPPEADRINYEIQQIAMDWLFGRKFETLETYAAGLSSVNADDVSAFGLQLQSTAIFALPGGIDLKPWMGKQAPTSTSKPVSGRRILSIDAPIERAWMVDSSDGISIKWVDGVHITVRYADLAAALHYDDGGLSLIGSDATWINVEPTLWRGGRSVCREILKRIPEQLILEQGARSAENIPKPKTNWFRRFIASIT